MKAASSLGSDPVGNQGSSFIFVANDARQTLLSLAFFDHRSGVEAPNYVLKRTRK